jgi:hypothetical protein
MMKTWMVGFGMALSFTVLHAPLTFAHDDEARVSVEREDASAIQAGRFTLEFQMIDLKKKTVLEDKDLALLSTKKLHVFIFDPALKEFRHEHAEFGKGQWHVSSEIALDGNYFLWVQGKIASDGEEFTSNIRLKVVGGKPANPTPPVLGDVRTGTDGTSRIALSSDRIVRTDGTEPKLSPYLGEPAHIVAVLEDGDSLVHAHPMESSDPKELMLHVTFPEAGSYRLWVQFLDAGVLRIIPLSVTAFAQ